MLEKWFKLKENNTTAKTEVMAGITTFMTMAYILAVNPTMLAAAGMDKTAVLIATALASFIGLQNGGIVVANSSTLVSYVDFTSNFKTAGICALLALIGLFVIAIMYIKNVKGAILFGIVITWVLGMLCQAAGIYVPDAEAGFYSLYPALGFTDLTAIGQTFGQCFKLDFSGVHVFDFIAVVCAFLFVDMFDTLGTLIGVANKADMLDKDGRLPRIKEALLADAVATTAGAVLGTSTTTTFVESSSGVAAGARTGLSSVVTGFLFLISVVLSPIFCSIPSFATAPALIFVGFLMVSTVTSIEFTDMTEAIPAYLCLLAMPLMYSISEGIAIGVISYVIINVVCGKAKKITPLMHKFFGTQNQGMVRFSFSYYNTVDEINEAAEALMQIAALR